jgi:hypothetical protein
MRNCEKCAMREDSVCLLSLKEIDVDNQPCKSMERYFNWLDSIVAGVPEVKHYASYSEIDNEYSGMNYCEIDIDESFNPELFGQYFLEIEEGIFRHIFNRDFDGDPATVNENDYADWHASCDKIIVCVEYTSEDFSPEDYKEMAGCEECHRRRDEEE